jgi:hypothetical protein
MPISEQPALDILMELIKKPDSKAEDIPRIWRELLGVYNTAFAPAAEPAPKKRRRGPKNPNIGWPAGVGRDEYRVWKDAAMQRGETENLNPQEYKRQRDAGEPGTAKPEKPAPKTKEELEATIPKRRGRPAKAE